MRLACWMGVIKSGPFEVENCSGAVNAPADRTSAIAKRFIDPIVQRAYARSARIVARLYMLYSMRSPLCLLLVAPLFAQAPVERPKVLGIAHVALYVGDLAKARAFYEGLLGFGEPFTLPKPDGSVSIAFVKINDHQYLELFNEDPKDDGRLSHISIYTGDADRMRDYLASRGVAVPATVQKGRTGNRSEEHTSEV